MSETPRRRQKFVADVARIYNVPPDQLAEIEAERRRKRLELARFLRHLRATRRALTDHVDAMTTGEFRATWQAFKVRQSLPSGDTK